MKPALVLLSDRDNDAPDLPGIATVSRDTEWDRGGWGLGIYAASKGRLWVDRPYWTGTPDESWLARKCAEITARGGYCQAGNELDLDYEGWTAGPEGYGEFWRRLHETLPEGNWLWQPPGGGANLAVWVPGSPGVNHAVHCYGSYAEMRARVQWYLDHTDGDLFITECNPGAGQVFDLDAWARNDLVQFLDWCSQHDRIKMVAYFAWRWDQSPKLPSSVDAAGTAIATALQTWKPVETVQPITPEQLGPGFWALYDQMGHKTGQPIEGEWSVMHEGEPGQSVWQTVRFANGKAIWDRDSNCVVYVGKDRLVMRAYGGRVSVLSP